MESIEPGSRFELKWRRKMKLEDRDLSETEKARIQWGFVYFFAALTLLRLAWDTFLARPFSWHIAIDNGLGLLICPFPLLIGLMFRRLLKRELAKDLLSARTYQVCDYWIAQLLVFAYLAIMVIEH